MVQYTNIHSEALKLLQKDQILHPLLSQCQPVIHSGSGQVLEYLVRSVISQQLSTAAAKTIYNRFLQLVRDDLPLEHQLTEIPEEDLRHAGISSSKSRYLREAANHFQQRELTCADWQHLSDNDIFELLLPIPGVGRWTVEMVLIFCLNREDVFPIDDLVIRQQIISLYQIHETGKFLRQRLESIGENWRPYRTFACRYLWAWNDESRKNK
ncbi:MAG: DNA-3-methyladenine glycosylase 2 family protein [Saprospiraceae bacterium]|jgi:DNA-3-methyladenine glycosylase II|nr:DNA-3-methyladenine glycosylase 2 family protein [Saprospiraceae bacterium]